MLTKSNTEWFLCPLSEVPWFFLILPDPCSACVMRIGFVTLHTLDEIGRQDKLTLPVTGHIREDGPAATSRHHQSSWRDQAFGESSPVHPGSFDWKRRGWVGLQYAGEQEQH